MSSNTETEGRSSIRDLLSRNDLIIETLLILAIAIFASFCASWYFVQTWTPRVTTWSIIGSIQQDALRTYWSLLVVPFIAMFAYLTSTVVAWDKGTAMANDAGRVSRRTPLVLMAFIIVFWTGSVIVYLAVPWALAIPLPDLVDVISSSLLPFAALAMICCVVLSSLVLVDERGFTNHVGLGLMILLLLITTGILARYWFM